MSHNKFLQILSLIKRKSSQRVVGCRKGTGHMASASVFCSLSCSHMATLLLIFYVWLPEFPSLTVTPLKLPPGTCTGLCSSQARALRQFQRTRAWALEPHCLGSDSGSSLQTPSPSHPPLQAVRCSLTSTSVSVLQCQGSY